MFTYNYMHKLPLLFSPESQPPREGQPFKGQQIPDVKHQLVTNVVHG